MDRRDEVEFAGAACLYTLWFWLPLALLAAGYWLTGRHSAGATVLGGMLIVAGLAWRGAAVLVHRRR